MRFSSLKYLIAINLVAASPQFLIGTNIGNEAGTLLSTRLVPDPRPAQSKLPPPAITLNSVPATTVEINVIVPTTTTVSLPTALLTATQAESDPPEQTTNPEQVDKRLWAISPTYSFKSTSPFSWTALPNTYLLSITVLLIIPNRLGNTEAIQLPLGECADDFDAECRAFENNGTASMGGDYAKGLLEGESYFFHLEWIRTDAWDTGVMSSPPFVMKDAIHVVTATTPTLYPTPAEKNSTTTGPSGTFTTSLSSSSSPSIVDREREISRKTTLMVVLITMISLAVLFAIGIFVYLRWMRYRRTRNCRKDPAAFYDDLHATAPDSLPLQNFVTRGR